MTAATLDDSELDKWDPEFLQLAGRVIGPLAKLWFRAEVRGLDAMPPTGGALLVCNHSGGAMTPDVAVLAPAFYARFGYGRPLYTLAHYGLFKTPLAGPLRRIGVIGASRENAAEALRSGAVVLVFPGGDYDSYRSTFAQNVIDFNGRRGYVRTAVECGVPIVPAVSIGAQETQLFLTQGARLAKLLQLHRIRMDIVPLTFGFPFGLTSTIPANFPLPSKIVTEVLEPIHIAERFGHDPDVDEVDAHVRGVMQRALDRLARQRRFPVLG
ncbi:lysophospholipid acyltransferase family protein [Mycobacterium sp. Marseille-P9652]|uniref:lysophospholipid acyltransferase family protein n=1 Tax=Mycobacterium sp. Marseille-P9652 TaxID=2654950 RepID=UPI0012E6FAEF|nr:lysophospholipid acyltransferase family protein [Mycobacterium sp. Marseille-P9652]